MPEVSCKYKRPRTDDCLSGLERDTLKELSENYKLNARQVLGKLKGPFAAGIMPTYPKLPDNAVAPFDINCLTDGGVLYPTVAWACLAGIGAWWPNPSENVGRPIQVSQEGAQAGTPNRRLTSNILHTKASDNDIQP